MNITIQAGQNQTNTDVIQNKCRRKMQRQLAKPVSAPCDFLFKCTMYKYTYLLTYLLKFTWKMTRCVCVCQQVQVTTYIKQFMNAFHNRLFYVFGLHSVFVALQTAFNHKDINSKNRHHLKQSKKYKIVH